MSSRWLAATVATAATVLLAGCSSPTPTIPTPTGNASKSASKTSSAEPTESSPAASADDTASSPLEGEACVEVTGANLDLATAMSAEDARTAADTLEKYGPPQSVEEAIEHFVETGGAQFDDPDYSKYDTAIGDWVHQVCPS